MDPHPLSSANGIYEQPIRGGVPLQGFEKSMVHSGQSKDSPEHGYGDPSPAVHFYVILSCILTPSHFPSLAIPAPG